LIACNFGFYYRKAADSLLFPCFGCQKRNCLAIRETKNIFHRSSWSEKWQTNLGRNNCRWLRNLFLRNHFETAFGTPDLRDCFWGRKSSIYRLEHKDGSKRAGEISLVWCVKPRFCLLGIQSFFKAAGSSAISTLLFKDIPNKESFVYKQRKSMLQLSWRQLFWYLNFCSPESRKVIGSFLNFESISYCMNQINYASIRIM